MSYNKYWGSTNTGEYLLYTIPVIPADRETDTDTQQRAVIKNRRIYIQLTVSKRV